MPVSALEHEFGAISPYGETFEKEGTSWYFLGAGVDEERPLNRQLFSGWGLLRSESTQSHTKSLFFRVIRTAIDHPRRPTSHVEYSELVDEVVYDAPTAVYLDDVFEHSEVALPLRREPLVVGKLLLRIVALEEFKQLSPGFVPVDLRKKEN